MKDTELNSISKWFLDWVNQDWKGIKASVSSTKNIQPGLYTYPVVRADGYKNRLHLRIDSSGNGILFVDVTDVIHLKGPATELVKMALDGVGIRDSKAIFKAKFRSRDGGDGEVEKAYQIVGNLLDGHDGCQTCALTGLLENAPLFSLQTNAPYKVDLALTYGCNNQCPHCYNEVNRLAMPSLPLEHWYKVIDRIAELGIPHLILTGGEATLHPDFLKIVRYADQLGLVVGLNSNGRYLGHAPFMNKASAAGLNHVQITLGSCDPEVHNELMGADSFNQTVRGIETALASGVHVITNTTLMRSNIQQIDEIIDFLYHLGIRTFAMNGMIHAGGGFTHPNAIHTSELPAIISRVRDLAAEYRMRFLWYTPTEYCQMSPLSLDVGVKKCNAGEYSICIEPNGDVLPCQSYYVTAGNFLTDEWEQIWQHDLFVSFREREIAPDNFSLPTKCNQCPDLLVCGAGCRIEREAAGGIRIAEIAGGGCIGCSGYFNQQEEKSQAHQVVTSQFEGGFVPFPSQRSDSRRSGGQVGFISPEKIEISKRNVE